MGFARSLFGVSIGSAVRVLSPSESESGLPTSGLPTPGVTNVGSLLGGSTFLYGVPSFFYGFGLILVGKGLSDNLWGALVMSTLSPILYGVTLDPVF